ncbi:MAG: family 1 extracellular solute-binding protein [Paenibacillus sp.]|jgi:multiple sugar transport system substrate-binding protein|nr:family 1 extracellular solute-binding protein [Paenibacillus sp.]
MRHAIKYSAALMLPCAIMLLAAACGKTETQPKAGEAAPPAAAPEAAQKKEPATINVYLQAAAYWAEEDFKVAIAEPIQKKYPHLTVNRVVKALPDALTAGETVDVYIGWMAPLAAAKELGIYKDITPQLKQLNVDLNRISPSALDMTKQLSDNGAELYGLPYSTHASGLYYNKSLFDKFGVAYPSDGMNWEQTLALGQKLTRSDGGTQYYGLNTDSYSRISFQQSLALIDTKTNKANVNTQPYRDVFEVYKKIFTSQGLNKTIGGIDPFIKTQNVAMYASINIWPSLRTANMNWDVAQFPSFPNRPNTYGMHDPHIAVLNKNSKHQEEALRVMEMIVSDSAQEYLVSTVGRFSTLADPKFNQMFGKSHPEFNGKRLASMLKSQPAPAAPISPYYEKANSIMLAKIPPYLSDQIDLNTMLRQAEEEINQYIASQKK